MRKVSPRSCYPVPSFLLDRINRIDGIEGTRRKRAMLPHARTRIEELLAQGMRVVRIAELMDVSLQTVYRLERETPRGKQNRLARGAARKQRRARKPKQRRAAPAKKPTYEHVDEPYQCRGCTEHYERPIYNVLKPCVACGAREMRKRKGTAI